MDAYTEAVNTCRVLKDTGFDVYLVGGCVRDTLMNRTPQDFDITTNALPDQIRSSFTKAGAQIIPIHGAEQHGVVFVNFRHHRYEIATFRGDKEYTDGRHCDIVTGVSLEEDLSRRDFTINAMALDPFTGTLIDPFGGQNDILFKRIRTVGNPEERFREDALRILRAYRFSAQLGFEITSSALRAARKYRDRLDMVSAERKAEELTKILCLSPSKLLAMDGGGILEKLLPELHESLFCTQNNPYHFCSVGKHSVLTAEYIDPVPELRFAAILHDLGKLTVKTTVDGVDHFYGHPKESARIAREILTRYKFSSGFVDTVVTLVQEHDRVLTTKRSIRRFIGKYDIEMLQNYYRLRIADALAHKTEKIPELLDDISRSLDIALEVIKEDPRASYKLKDLAINGEDLKQLGIPEGPEVGRLLRLAYEVALGDPKKNNREELLAVVEKEIRS